MNRFSLGNISNMQKINLHKTHPWLGASLLNIYPEIRISKNMGKYIDYRKETYEVKL